jgi:hypothetical protein
MHACPKICFTKYKRGRWERTKNRPGSKERRNEEQVPTMQERGACFGRMKILLLQPSSFFLLHQRSPSNIYIKYANQPTI